MADKKIIGDVEAGGAPVPRMVQSLVGLGTWNWDNSRVYCSFNRLEEATRPPYLGPMYVPSSLDYDLAHVVELNRIHNK